MSCEFSNRCDGCPINNSGLTHQQKDTAGKVVYEVTSWYGTEQLEQASFEELQQYVRGELSLSSEHYDTSEKIITVSALAIEASKYCLGNVVDDKDKENIRVIRR